MPAENNLLQFYLEDAEKFTMENKMKINPRKTKVLSFNKSRKYDFPPELHLPDSLNLTVVSELQLVGVVLTNNLKWQNDTDYICQKATQKLWTLKRLKRLKFDDLKIFDVYMGGWVWVAGGWIN